MPMNTYKSNATAHPGHIVLENQTLRWTKKQIQMDNARAEKAALAERDAEEACNKSIAEVEDGIEMNKVDIRIHANRPDLCYKPVRGSTEEEEAIVPTNSNQE